MTDAWECPKCGKKHELTVKECEAADIEGLDDFYIDCDCGTKFTVEWEERLGWKQTITLDVDENQQELKL